MWECSSVLLNRLFFDGVVAYLVYADGPNIDSRVSKVVIGVRIGFPFCYPLELGACLTLKAKLGCEDGLLEVGEDIED